uniref:Uncharacterized protein n=1 Tax=Panagrolaimus davidi TaxID=227884 RepID=A0A914P4H6_9BILA
MARILFIFLAFIAVCYGCQSGIKSVARDMQKRHPQKCMQCPEITVSKQCNYETMDKGLTCGQSHIDVYTYWNKTQMCAKMTVHCSARPPKTIDARIAVEEVKVLEIPKPIENVKIDSEFQIDQNQTFLTNENQTFTNETALTKEELGLVEDGSGTEIFFDESNDGPIYSYITKEEKFHAFSYLTCNDEGKWETFDPNGKKYEGIETVHCIVSNM